MDKKSCKTCDYWNPISPTRGICFLLENNKANTMAVHVCGDYAQRPARELSAEETQALNDLQKAVDSMSVRIEKVLELILELKKGFKG